MGMYTELIFGASFKEDTPKDLIDTIRYMAGDLEEKPEPCLWQETRNPISWGCSYYFAISESVTKMWFDDISNQWVLSSRCNLKNYNDEIETFLEMVKPWIESGSGSRDMYAIVIYEEQAEPTIYYLKD